MKSIVLVLSVVICGGLYAQETAKSVLLELESIVSVKKFDKKWNKKRAEWEAILDDAQSMDEVHKSFNEYSDLMAQTVGFSMGNSDGMSELEFLEYLLKVDGTLPAEYVENWSAEDRDRWRGWIKEELEAAAKKKEKADQMARFQKMSSIVKDFDKKFAKVWEDAKKNQFKTVVESGLKFSGADIANIEEDQYGVKSYHLFFETDGDEKMAEKLQAELEAIVLSVAGDGFKAGNTMDAAFTGSLKHVIQFEGEKFAETAKKPTVEVGVLKDKAGVDFVVIEPVFGH